MYILTNISYYGTDGRLYAGSPTYFDTEKEAVEKAWESLTRDFGLSMDEVKEQAQEGIDSTYSVSMNRDGRLEAYVVSELAKPDTVMTEDPAGTSANARKDDAAQDSIHPSERKDDRNTVIIRVMLVLYILISLCFFAKTNAVLYRLDRVSPRTEVKELHGLVPGRKYTIEAKGYREAGDEAPVIEGRYIFTASSPDQEILIIYDDLRGEIRYRLLPESEQEYESFTVFWHDAADNLEAAGSGTTMPHE